MSEYLYKAREGTTVNLHKFYIAAVIAVSVILAGVWGISEFYSEEAVPVISYADEGGAVTGIVYTPVLVDINTANLGELQELSGIGRATAEKIIAYRDKNGGFEDVTELLEIDGIGEKTLSGFADKISLSGKHPEAVFTETEAVTEEIINLNTADKETLMKLDGIGDKTAEKIIAYAAETGFDDVSELLEIDGIGKSKFEKIKPYVTVD